MKRSWLSRNIGLAPRQQDSHSLFLVPDFERISHQGVQLARRSQCHVPTIGTLKACVAVRTANQSAGKARRFSRDSNSNRSRRLFFGQVRISLSIIQPGRGETLPCKATDEQSKKRKNGSWSKTHFESSKLKFSRFSLRGGFRFN